MYSNILVPIALDHDHSVAPSLDIARRLLSEGGRITALHVMELVPGYAAQYLPEGHLEHRQEDMEAALRTAIGADSGIECIVVSGHAGRAITDWAEDHDVDCIVIASHRPGLQDYFLGSTAARVVRHAQSAVHVLR